MAGPSYGNQGKPTPPPKATGMMAIVLMSQIPRSDEPFTSWFDRYHGRRLCPPRQSLTAVDIVGVAHRSLLVDGWQVLDEVSARGPEGHAAGPPGRRIDLLALRPVAVTGTLFERLAIEIKVNRQDFRADINDSSKQQVWRDLTHGHAFCAPAGLISSEELPPGSGLLEVFLLQLLRRQTESLELRWTVMPPWRDAGPEPGWLFHELAYRASRAARQRHLPWRDESEIPATALRDICWVPPSLAEVSINHEITIVQPVLEFDAD